MESLYHQIGASNLQKLVDEFYERVFDSASIKHLFQTDKETIKRKQLYFLTQFLGGPQLYTENYGHPRMRMRHLPHEITQESKIEWLRCMKEAIATLDVTDQLKTSLYACFPQVAEHMVNS